MAAAAGAVVVAGGGGGGEGGGAARQTVVVPRPRPVTALSVKGNQLVTAAGRPVRLLGVNRDGTETKCTEAGGGVFDGPTDQTSVTAMARWNINAVRIPLHEACWLGINELPVGGTAAAHRRAIERYVQLLAPNGMYAVLALHVAAPGRVRTTANEQLPLPDAGHGPAFWRSVARRFHDSPAVLFDLYGEPHDVTWECWRDGCSTGGLRLAGMQRLVRAVRGTGARQPILIGGLSYGGDVRGWLGYRPKDPLRRLVVSLTTFEFSACDAA